MQELSISGNQGSQAYGNDVGGGVILGAMVRATVVEKLGDNLYLLQIGRNTIEAKVAADLEQGAEYRFVVEKGGQPPELALIKENSQQPLANGLSAEENRWVSRLASLMGQDPQEVDLKSLLQLVRSLGVDTDMPVDKAFQKLKPVLNMLPTIDGAPPVIRQLMGQTLLFTMHQQSASVGDAWFEQAIRLSGDIPKWNEKDSALLLSLKNQIELLPENEKQALKTQLLGLDRKDKLNDLLGPLVEKALKANATGQAVDPKDAVAKVLEELRGDATRRLFLSANTSSGNSDKSLGSLGRSEAIMSFQRQAPGLATSDISNLLEQFTSLGGKVEKLSVGDVISAQLSWKGGTPSAMQLHRTGAVMFLAQDVPSAQRQFSNSELITRAPSGVLPVVLNNDMVSDPSMSSLSLNKLKEFSQQASLPSTYHVDRLLQNWHQSGGSLSELRGHLDAITKWNQFIESFPEFRNSLAEHLVKARSVVNQSVSAGPSTVSVKPETQQSFMDSLAQSGAKMSNIPQKELSQVMQSVQQVAGEGQAPSKSLLAVATWMVVKGIEVTPQSLQSLLMFQQGHPEAKGLYQDIANLQQMLQKENPEMAKSLSAALGPLSKEGSDLKDLLSFYQKGNGQNLRQWLGQAQEWSSRQSHLPQELQTALHQLQGKLGAQEDFLSGLKHYNIQAQRQDTPKVFEIPVLFGADTDRALLRVYKREPEKSNRSGEDRNYKVVIDLDLEGLGKVRSEVSLFNKHLQLDFLSSNDQSLKALKASSEILGGRLEEKQLNATMGFKLKAVEGDTLLSEQKSQSAPSGKANIDISV
jgi:hypothetical protein